MLLKEGGRKRGRCFSEEDVYLVRKRGEQLVQDKVKYGDGVAWSRGSLIGKGSFGSVYLATLKKPKSRYSSFPSVMAVKSAEVSVSGSIQKEREVLNNVKGCSNVIKCYGEETTLGENGEMVYNLLLEYGSGGTLANVIKQLGCNGLPEFEVRCYTRSILRGLCHIHDCGYVHCDLKPDNILLVKGRKGAADFTAKIGDLGLAKRDRRSKNRKVDPYWRGTPMYLSPEAVVDGLQGPPCDIWALGCIVLEMLTGKPPWNGKEDLDAKEILSRIAEGKELPRIPSTISKEARSFLKGCFVSKAMYRLTAQMLLNHPFVEELVAAADDDDKIEEFEELSDINVISSMLVLSETDDDELGCSSFSEEWSYASEEEFSSSWSEQDADDVEHQVGPSFCADGTFKVQEIRDVKSNAVQPHPISFTISAGV